MTQLSSFLSQFDPTPYALNVVHCTTVDSALKIFEKMEIEVKLCNVYSEELIYCFYGRPAYKPLEGVQASSIIDLAPVCLVFDSNLLDCTHRILPFDSGGFDRYKNDIGLRSLNLSNFELGNSSDMPLRFVSAFFTTNKKYFYQTPAAGKDISIKEQEARAIERLINNKGLCDFDDRCSTIELQFSANIALSSALKAIIAPSALMDDDEIIRSIKKDVILMPYSIYGRCKPEHFCHTIMEKTENLFSNLGVFS